MNRLNIGETILQLRKEKNITQEQLAFMVGVSAGAVSKWENGNSMPDITLIAPLARALNTSLDVLFSFEQEVSETEVTDIKQELIKLFLHEGYASGEVKCKKYLNKYPNSIHLKTVIAGLLNMYLMMSENSSEEFTMIKRQEILDLCKQIVESREPKYTPVALFLIATINIELENYEDSEKALKELPETIDPMTLYPFIYMKQGKNEEAAKLCNNKLLQYLTNSCLMLITLSRISKREKNYDQAFFYLDACYKMQNIFKMGLNSAEYQYVQLYIETGDKEAAAKWFETYVEGVISAEYDYRSNPYFEKVELEIKLEEQKIIRKKMFESMTDDKEFKVLIGIPEYEEAIEKLKIAESEI